MQNNLQRSTTEKSDSISIEFSIYFLYIKIVVHTLLSMIFVLKQSIQTVKHSCINLLLFGI